MQKNYLCKIFFQPHLQMKSLTTTYRIRTSDVDIRKNYKAFAFMSMAQEMANRHASRIGFGYDDLIRDNISWVVSRMRVKYLEAPNSSPHGTRVRTECSRSGTSKSLTRRAKGL